MKKRDLYKLGLEGEEVLSLAIELCTNSRKEGIKKAQLKRELKDLVANPTRYVDNPFYGALAKQVINFPKSKAKNHYEFRTDLSYACWGEDIEADALRQMENACSLPISVKGALMPDAHVGYGLPIGGVLATKGAVIPYAVGVDIACRVMLSVFDFPIRDLKRKRDIFEAAILKNTRFGVGAKWNPHKEHKVLDMDWSFSPRVASLKDMAVAQLGTSGSGNHFVEFGEFHLAEDHQDLKAGAYVALVSHSGSRGVGNKLAEHYSSIAKKVHPGLPKAVSHLAWLNLDSEAGQEYWAAMELMGHYASANHHIIHRSIARHLNAPVLLQVENHHNFAWKEEVDGEELVVHRKGATPASAGLLGYIPGSMTAPGFLVQGLGNPESINSCSHGAGRLMSRKKAKNTITKKALRAILEEHGVHLISAGLDEAPHAYKDIYEVMAAQSDLITKLAKFQPRIVKMAAD